MAGASAVLIRGCLVLHAARPRFPSGRISRRYPVVAVRPSAPASVRGATGAATLTAAAEETVVDAEADIKINKLACPICYYPLSTRRDRTISSTPGSGFECHTCKKIYLNNDSFTDLTLSSGSITYSETKPAATEIFRTRLVSFLYERGWRQSFIFGGFPGVEKEFEMAQNYLKSAMDGTIVDASCGSGLFSRLFVKSGNFALVVALDFSENMLRQCSDFIKQENISSDNIILVRADISRLPFSSGSIDGVHAGAAIHCWPSPANAVAEISRVLHPGGVFVASTYILDAFRATPLALRAVRESMSQITGNNFFRSEAELEDLCRACGLVDFTCVRNMGFIMFSATKPIR